LSILLITLLNIKSVNAQTISLGTSLGVFGTPVMVTGSGFFVNDTTCTISGGAVTGSFVVGNAQANDYLVTVTGFPGPPQPPDNLPVPDSAQAAFEIYLSLNPISAQVGSIIEVFGA